MKKAAFVAVIGRPSAGKSTLVNYICGEKVAIVSAVPQTTRNAIRGIVNREAGQLVFIDTPGRHLSEKKTNKKLVEISGQAADDADIILYVLDASRPPGPEEEEIAAFLAPHAGRTVAAINKIDAADGDRSREFLVHTMPGLPADRCFLISGKTGEGIEPLLAALFGLADEGEPFYSEEYYTDQEVDFRIAEIIREQAINRLRQELPHSLRVEIADAQLTEAARPADAAYSAEAGPVDAAPGRQKLWVRAFIVVERESQKGIVVGAGGSMIKAIRLAALKELRRIFDWYIELDLRVKSASN